MPRHGDALGRLVLSQNTKQFNMATQRFSYSLYDALGRVYEAGELEDDGNAPDRFQDLPATNVNGALLPNVLDPDVLKAWVLGRPRFEVTRTYYDAIFPSLTIPGFAQENLRLRVASTVYYDAWEEGTTPEADYAHATHYSYDIHGNVKTLVQEHDQLGIDGGAIDPGCTGCLPHRYKRMDYTYDLISGNVRQVDYQKDQPDALHHRYTYDADNRITEVETSADAQNWHHDARYFYYPHGPLQRVELGEHLVQGTDYAYTLQGWLKGINGDRLNPTTDMGRDGDATVVGNPNLLTGRDAYALSLGYYGDNDYKAITPSWSTVATRAFAPVGASGTMNTEHSPLYNGNIAHTVNTLQHFGLWDATNGGQGQVLAMVYRYDQLNRLRTARGVIGLGTTNTWNTVADAATNRYRSEYTYDANGNIETVERYDADGTGHYDSFAYHYHTNGGRKQQNRLYQLIDDATMNTGSDIVTTATGFDNTSNGVNVNNNYGYDALGNLVRDDREDIERIHWTVAGKVDSIQRPSASSRSPLKFRYGASGQRVSKQVGDFYCTEPGAYREHYIRDAQGNIMATYRYTNNAGASLKLNERPVYGSSRLGSLRKEVELHTLAAFDPASANPVQMVDLNYELTDHLGNVCAVVTGRLLDGNGGGTAKQAELVSAQGYEAFGALLPGRNYSSGSYRMSFNGQEKDDEIHGATGTSYAFEYRMYDSRVARFLSIDPLAAKFPYMTPYQFASNNPIWMFELEGLEGIASTDNSIVGAPNSLNSSTDPKGQRQERYTAISEQQALGIMTDPATPGIVPGSHGKPNERLFYNPIYDPYASRSTGADGNPKGAFGLESPAVVFQTASFVNNSGTLGAVGDAPSMAPGSSVFANYNATVARANGRVAAIASPVPVAGGVSPTGLPNPAAPPSIGNSGKTLIQITVNPADFRPGNATLANANALAAAARAQFPSATVTVVPGASVPFPNSGGTRAVVAGSIGVNIEGTWAEF